VRAAIRSRVLLSLLAALALVSFGIPLTIRGDGTAAGQIRIMIQYTFALATIVVGAGAIWSGAAAIAAEIESGDIRLVVVKPVRPFEIWLGKWIGLTAMNGLLLASSAAAMAGLVAFRTDTGDPAAAGVLSARRVLEPRAEPVAESEIGAEFAAMAGGGEIPADAPLARYRDAVRQRIMARRNAVAGGTARSWAFDASALSKRPDRVQVRFLVSSGSFTASALSGEWLAGPPDRPEAALVSRGSFGEGLHTLDIPESAVPPAGDLLVTFRNDPGAPTAVFPGGGPVRILAGGGSFGWNLARAVLSAWACMAALTAIALTAGTLFSFPVAAFVSCSSILMLLISNYYAGSPDIPQPEGAPFLDAVQSAGIAMAGAVHLAGGRVLDAVPAGRLADGILVSPAETAADVLILMIAYPLAIGAAGSWLLGRREIAVADVS